MQRVKNYKSEKNIFNVVKTKNSNNLIRNKIIRRNVLNRELKHKFTVD